MLILSGSNALSAFRTQRLLASLQAVNPTVSAVFGRYLHFIDAAASLSQADVERLEALLEYGDPYVESESGEESAEDLSQAMGPEQVNSESEPSEHP